MDDAKVSEWAETIKKVFDALILRGFTEAQAIEIMCAAFGKS